MRQPLIAGAILLASVCLCAAQQAPANTQGYDIHLTPQQAVDLVNGLMASEMPTRVIAPLILSTQAQIEAQNKAADAARKAAADAVLSPPDAR